MSSCMRLVARVAALLALAAAADASRWSRQISSYTADTSDWVPLPGPAARDPPSKRQAVAEPRILAEPFNFPPQTFRQEPFPQRINFQAPSNRQLYLQSVPSVPSAPQNFLTDQGFGQGFRFGLSPGNIGLNQGFVGPQVNFDSYQINNQFRQQLPSPPPNPVNFPKPTLNVSPQAKPFNANQGVKPKPVNGQKFVDGYQLENGSDTVSFPGASKKKPQSLQKLKYENDKPKPAGPIPVNKPKSEREEVQLLYVPVESLNRGQYNFKSQPVYNTDPFTQDFKPVPKQQAFASDFQRPITKPLDSFNLGQEYFTGQNAFGGQNYEPQKYLDQEPKFSTISSPYPSPPPAPTTARPKKLKPHQPPLAVFFAYEGRKGDKAKVGDVLIALKNAKSVAVLDSVSPNNAPKVFIGPSSLAPPEHYVKFELPYMSNLENSDKKLKQLPFFVAPLSYNTPDGFAKIPFPSPHVGSVIVNAQVKENANQYTSLPAADIIPNSYTPSTPSYKQEKPSKPTFSYYSTAAPKTNSPPPNKEYHNNHYSFEPQTVSTIRPQAPKIATAAPKPGSYFLNDNDHFVDGQFVEYENPDQKYNENIRGFKQTETEQRYTTRPQYSEGNFESSTKEPVRNYNSAQQAKSSTPRTTTRVSSTKQAQPPASTYPSHLLETHNPYSINQAFHLNTPIEYQNYYDEYKEGYLATPGSASPAPAPVPAPSSTDKPEPINTEKPKYQQTSPNYAQNYSPEIHYESENSKYPSYSSSEYSNKPEGNLEVSSPVNTEYSTNVDTQPSVQYENPTQESARPTANSEENYYQSTGAPNAYNQYISSQEYKEPVQQTTSSTTTPAPTTKRTPLRARNRPRYSTARPDSAETTKAPVTRRPLRERRPLATRPRYEPNKITTEKATRKSVDSSEATTRATTNRGRTRGRVQFNATDNYESFDGKKTKSSDGDLAYQRDVLHQNYPVTIQERMSTVDVEAQTEPLPRFSSTKNVELNTETYIEPEQAFSNEQAYSHEQSLQEQPRKVAETTYTRNNEYQTESYAPRLQSTRTDDYSYSSSSSRGSASSQSYSDSGNKEDTSEYYKPTTPVRVSETITEPTSPSTEEPVKYSYDNNYSIRIEEDLTTAKPDFEITKIASNSQSEGNSENTEEDVPQTTPSYRVRVRPGGVRQYQQSSTEASSTTTLKTTPKIDRRRPSVQAVTYRPAYDRRRTTMRIEEIETELKTKSIHARPDQDYRHPVYKHEPTTAPPPTTAVTEPTKRGQFRRRRPSYSTTSTEAAVTKKATYEIKNRFKGRRPTTERAQTEKTEAQTDALSSTVRTAPYSRYARPRLSERYNKKTAETNDENEDQEPNYSVNRPRYVAPEEDELVDDQWSAKFSESAFRPYNPNDIQDDKKIATTERRSDKFQELDIITARNEFDDILLAVTPASNRAEKKVPEIPPTLEALVEQTKTSDTESAYQMSTFETMLEEVMKGLEERDENEYASKVMKHKGGEIGEIPPEDTSLVEPKTTTAAETEATTVDPESNDTASVHEEEQDKRGPRRGFWKKVKVRPVTPPESIETAESQYYSNTFNHLSDGDKPARPAARATTRATTYKPAFDFDKLFDDETLSTAFDISKITTDKPEEHNATTVTEAFISEESSTETVVVNPGEVDLGTGSPDTTILDTFFTTTTEASSEASEKDVDRSEALSLMEYLFGVTSSGSEEDREHVDSQTEVTELFENETAKSAEDVKSKSTTESPFVPDEVTAVSNTDDTTEGGAELVDLKKVIFSDILNGEEKREASTEKVVEEKVETSSQSSFMDPNNVLSTSMSTEVSHETEICFRGKCIKSNKDAL